MKKHSPYKPQCPIDDRAAPFRGMSGSMSEVPRAGDKVKSASHANKASMSRKLKNWAKKL